MIKTTLLWKKTLGIPQKSLINLLFFVMLEATCQIFIPISFANIVSTASNLSTRRAILWTIINFSIHILKSLTHSIKLSSLENLELIAKEKASSLNLDSATIQTLCHFPRQIDSYLVLWLRLISISIAALIYSFNLCIYVVGVFSLCLIVAKILSIKKFKHLNIIIDLIWSIATLFITIYIIILFSNQAIYLTAFLVLSTFINTYLIKPDFDFTHNRDIKLVTKNLLDLEQSKK